MNFSVKTIVRHKNGQQLLFRYVYKAELFGPGLELTRSAVSSSCLVYIPTALSTKKQLSLIFQFNFAFPKNTSYLATVSKMTLPQTFKQAVFKSAGAPLEIEETSMTLPATDQILVKVEACGVCFSDMFAQNNVMGGGLYVLLFRFVPACPFLVSYRTEKSLTGPARLYLATRSLAVWPPWETEFLDGQWETVLAGRGMADMMVRFPF